MRVAICIATLLSLLSSATAQDAYVDDRSTPSALIRSFYNAISRGEYARAYAYFAKPPEKDVKTFAEGYSTTEFVEVLTGTARENTVDGETQYELPVALRATHSSGHDETFAGCYTLRLANPTGTNEAFVPLSIVRGALKTSSAEFEDAVPRSCGIGEELPAYDAALEKAKALHAIAAGAHCETDPAAMFEEDREPLIYSMSFRHEYESEDDPEHVVRLFRFFCYRGAYNESHIFYLADEDGRVEQLQFSRPELEIRYEDDDSDKPVESVRIDGFSSRADVVNSDFDEQTQTIWELSKWRGIGDAGSVGRWQFRQGKFRLVYFEVDASYDGEHEAEVVLDYETAP